jgi:hypothetical protein
VGGRRQAVGGTQPAPLGCRCAPAQAISFELVITPRAARPRDAERARRLPEARERAKSDAPAATSGALGATSGSASSGGASSGGEGEDMVLVPRAEWEAVKRQLAEITARSEQLLKLLAAQQQQQQQQKAEPAQQQHKEEQQEQ